LPPDDRPGPSPRARLRKAIIPLAGRATRLYPATSCVRKGLIPLVDRDGLAKPTIQIILEEAVAAGIEEICLIVGPGDREAYERHFAGLTAEQAAAFAGKDWALEQAAWLVELGRRLRFVPQPEPLGYGHAVWCGREFAAGEPVLVMLGDHVYTSDRPRNCAGQMVDVFERYGRPVSGVSVVGEEELPYFGTLRARLMPGETRVYEAERIVEKPPVALARAELRAEGLPDGRYLCFFGLHAMTPGIFDCLSEAVARQRERGGEVELTSSQASLLARERYLAYVVDGERHDTGIPGELARTQLALAARSPYRALVAADARRLGLVG
jgi:UTP--glucose-1-phosphate uridylyltransferase